jgi:hypothetical protein
MKVYYCNSRLHDYHGRQNRLGEKALKKHNCLNKKGRGKPCPGLVWETVKEKVTK